jgi:hypothetical protein
VQAGAPLGKVAVTTHEVQRFFSVTALGKGNGLKRRLATTLIVVGGLIVLFTPGLFETFPSSLRDGRTGLVVLVGVQLLALATLAKVAGPSLANIS